jgi:TRAP-type C4-dicarboxylate transport system substrate-binding protein
MTKPVGILLAAALAAGLASACGSAASQGDKAGRPAAPVVLRLADPYDSSVSDADALAFITNRISRVSHGKLRVKIAYNAAGQNDADVEARVARLVQKGRFDLGWIGTRAWDEVGLKSFQALQAPFLITDYKLLDRVATSRMADRMLAELNRLGLVGLVLVPDLMRHPVGLTRPLSSVADFRGARVRDVPSKATDALLHALGATPVHLAGADVSEAIATHRIDGSELAIVDGFGAIVTGNVNFFPKVMTLFAGQEAFDRLTDEQKGFIATALEQFRRHIFEAPENAIIRRICADRPAGRIVVASPSDLAALERAARPVYAELERDPQTRARIAEIRRLKASLPPARPVIVPAGCGAAPPPTATVGRTPEASALNGTYRYLLTAAAARKFGQPADGSDGKKYPVVVTAVLRDGKLVATLDQPPEQAVYSVDGNRFSIRLRGNAGPPLVFTFTRDDDGTLHLKPVLPMDPGDQWVWSGGGAPWHRIGPPSSRELR